MIRCAVGRLSWGEFLGGIAVLGVCLVVTWLTPTDSYWIGDCGNKALQAARMLETRYTELNFDYPGERFDPEHVAFPIAPPFAIPRDRGFASFYPPAYAALAAPFLALLGPAGLRIPAAIGTAASAFLFAAWISPIVGRKWAAAGGLALGLGTPMFFYGVTVWEYSITVALSLGAWTALSSTSRSRLLVAGSLIGVACWFREVLALMGIALALACYLHRRRASDLLGLALGAAPAILALLLFNWIAYDHPLGPHFIGTLNAEAQASGWSAIGGKVGVGTGRALVGLAVGLGWTPAEAWILALMTAAAVGLGVLGALQSRAALATCIVVTGLSLGLWGLGFARVFMAADPLWEAMHYNGFIARVPLLGIAGFGLVALQRRPEFESVKIGITAGIAFLVLGSLFGALTKVHSGVHWGPRVLLPAMPGVLALGLAWRPQRGIRGGPSATARAWITTCLILAGLASSGQAAWLLAEQKGEARRLETAIALSPQPVVLTPERHLAQHLAGLWRQKPILLLRQPETLHQLEPGLRREGVREFLLVARGPSPLAGVRCRLIGLHRGQRIHYFDVNLYACELRGSGSPRRPTRR